MGRITDDLLAAGGVVLPGGPNQPALIHLSARTGVTGIEIDDVSDGSGVEVSLAALGRSLETLQLMLDGIDGVAVRGLLVCPSIARSELGNGPKFRSVIAADELAESSCVEKLRTLPRALTDDAFAALRAALCPQSLFVRSRSTADETRAEREAKRLQLDLAQERLAMRPHPGVLLISGGAGTGKTLVAVARARRLSEDHPDWRVGLLCFNRTLATQLESMVAKWPAVEVATFYSWASSLGVTLDLRSADRSEGRADAAAARGTGRESYDALVIDEAQDFAPAWLRLARQTVRPGRGGMAILSDPAQALYGEGDLHRWTDEEILEEELTHGYRSTHQILTAAVESSGVGDVPAETLDGRPVQLVWANRWDAQAACICWEIQALVESGSYNYRDIGLLYTQRAGSVNRLRAALDAEGVPYYWVNEDNTSKRTLPDTDTVWLMTVHAAKGFEFPSVFLFAVEALRVDGVAGEERDRMARVAYVGMTRAKDLLTVTYTRPNQIIERLSACEQVEQWTWPDDYEVR